MEQAKAFLLEKFYSKADPVALEALKVKENVATEETMIESTGMLRLQKMFPDMEVDVLSATLRAFNDNVNEAAEYLEQNGSVMHSQQLVRNEKK